MESKTAVAKANRKFLKDHGYTPGVTVAGNAVAVEFVKAAKRISARQPKVVSTSIRNYKLRSYS